MKTLQFLFALSVLILTGCDSGPEKKGTEPRHVEDRSRNDSSKINSETFNNRDFLIEDGAAGIFELGKPIPVSLKDYSITKVKQTRTTEEGPTQETVYLIAEGDTEILNILPAIDPNTGQTTGDIGELRIKSEKYKTAEGIGVGSTIEEFIEAYPDHKIWFTYVSNMYVIQAEELEAQFLLDEEDFTGEMKVTSAMTPLKKEDFREGARISLVRMI